jgi:hypothetical protein
MDPPKLFVKEVITTKLEGGAFIFEYYKARAKGNLLLTWCFVFLQRTELIACFCASGREIFSQTLGDSVIIGIIAENPSSSKEPRR